MYELYDPCTVMFFFRNKVRLPSFFFLFNFKALDPII
ncbi:MAG: hypothetical protein ACPGYJ_04060 [bacterium]